MKTGFIRPIRPVIQKTHYLNGEIMASKQPVELLKMLSNVGIQEERKTYKT